MQHRHDTNLDKSMLKTFAEDKIYVDQKLKLVLGRTENIVGKEKMLVDSIFTFSNNVSKRLLSSCRRQICLAKGRKHCGKVENAG